jgi:hypothetical protein
MHPDEIIFDYLATQIDDTKLAIDIGSKYGAWSKKLNDKLPNLKIKQFEPRKGDVALSNYEGKSEFYIDVERKGWSGLKKQRDAVYETIQVDVKTLDSFEFNNVGFIKIDVEGNELYTLMGAEMTLFKNRPIIYFECADVHLENYDYTSEQLYGWLKENYYNIYDIQRTALSLKRFKEYCASDETWKHNFIGHYDYYSQINLG